MFLSDATNQSSCRREFLKGAACAGVVAAVPCVADAEEDEIALWQTETERIAPETYMRYLHDGKTCGFFALEKLEAAAEKALERVKAKRVVFGHLWELGHKPGHRGRLDEPLIRPRLAIAKEAEYTDVQLAFWGDRVS